VRHSDPAVSLEKGQSVGAWSGGGICARESSGSQPRFRVSHRGGGERSSVSGGAGDEFRVGGVPQKTDNVSLKQRRQKEGEKSVGSKGRSLREAIQKGRGVKGGFRTTVNQ